MTKLATGGGAFAEHGGYAKLVFGMLVGSTPDEKEGYFGSGELAWDACLGIKHLAPDFGGLAFWDVLDCPLSQNRNCTATGTANAECLQGCTSSGWNEPDVKLNRWPSQVRNACLRLPLPL
jgi:hypothetical protein